MPVKLYCRDEVVDWWRVQQQKITFNWTTHSSCWCGPGQSPLCLVTGIGMKCDRSRVQSSYSSLLEVSNDRYKDKQEHSERCGWRQQEPKPASWVTSTSCSISCYSFLLSLVVKGDLRAWSKSTIITWGEEGRVAGNKGLEGLKVDSNVFQSLWVRRL